MTALGIDVVTLAFPDPDLSGSADDVGTSSVSQLNASISFSFSESGNVRTLSTTGVEAGTEVSGLLYTPVPSSTLCSQWPLYVPKNATQVVLPRAIFGFIALAPWISQNCTLAYLAAVQQDPVRAFIFYLPGNSSDTPPLANDPAWALGDGGKWKSSNKFPVYAIPSDSGNQIMSQLTLYTGNLTSVPNGHELANSFPASDYVRLALRVDMSADSNLPSLWVFLLIVLGILILIIGSSSFIMHCVQRRRRERLRRRIASGQVDLEALGIKRLTVPQDILDKLPLYIYLSDPPQPSDLGTEETSSTLRNSNATDPDKPIATDPDKPIATEPRLFTQTTCAICLDDFVSNDSLVRELPCAHIFHSSCIDPFLRENSSLCPMCKKTVLPHGFCPAVVTNAMVRRERMVRRMRERRAHGGHRDDEEGGMGLGRFGALAALPRLGNAVTGRVFRAPVRRSEAAGPAQPGVEMRSTAASVRPTRNVVAPTAAAANDGDSGHEEGQLCDVSAERAASRTERQGRREWVRQRVLAMRRNREAEDEGIEEEVRRRPAWRGFAGRIWPGLL